MVSRYLDLTDVVFESNFYFVTLRIKVVAFDLAALFLKAFCCFWSLVLSTESGVSTSIIFLIFPFFATKSGRKPPYVSGWPKPETSARTSKPCFFELIRYFANQSIVLGLRYLASYHIILLSSESIFATLVFIIWTQAKKNPFFHLSSKL